MSLNSYKTFTTIALVMVGIYYFKHIRTADFVYEDTEWVNSKTATSFISELKSLPNKDLVALTIIPNHPKIAHSINLAIHILNALILSLLIERWNKNNGWIIGSLFL